MPAIEVDPDNLHLFGLQMAGRVSLSGVQRKISLGLERKTLRVVAAHSQFILKPRADEYPSLPENEHLSLSLAKLLGFDVPPFGLVRLRDDSLALLVKRFDRTSDGGRIPMEDFCQLTGRFPSDKYDGSVEGCARAIRRFSAEPPIDLVRLYRLLLLSWWIGNGDLHLKNLSLLSAEKGHPRLSPVYDLVNTAILIPDDQMALTMCGKRSRFRERDWLEFADYCHIPPEVVDFEAWKLIRRGSEAMDLALHSFLREDLRFSYVHALLSGWERLIRLRDMARRKPKATRLRTGPRPVTAKECDRTAHILRATLESQGIRLEETPLEGDIQEVSWLAGTEEDIFASDGPFESEPERAVRALVKFLRLDRTRKALQRSIELPGFGRVAKALKQISVSLSGTEDSQAWDRLFELELAAQLVCDHWRIEFGEADVLLVDARGDALGWECKRPRNARTIRRNVDEACRQLQQRQLPGIVAVNLDLLHDGWIDARGSKQIPDLCEQRLDSIVGDLRRPVAESLARRALPDTAASKVLLGILFCSNFLVIGEDRGRVFINTRLQPLSIPNPALPDEGRGIEFFANVLRMGEQQLRAQP